MNKTVHGNPPFLSIKGEFNYSTYEENIIQLYRMVFNSSIKCKNVGGMGRGAIRAIFCGIVVR
jgi:hypothetical protein